MPERVNPELLAAVKRGEAERVRSLCAQGLAVDARDPTGFTSLMWAAEKGHLEVVTVLIDHGAALEATDGQGMTALCRAMMNGQLESMRLLLRRGARWRLALPNGVDLLALAADWDPVRRRPRKADTAIVRDLLGLGLEVDHPDSLGVTALMVAATWGRHKVVQVLLDAGARVDAATADASTALIDAVKGGSLPTVRALVRAGADVNACDRWGRTVLMLAQDPSHAPALAQWLERQGAELVPPLERLDGPPVERAVNVLVHAAARNDIHVVQALLERGIAVDGVATAAGRTGQTALHAACYENALEAVRLLVARGARIDARVSPGWGSTPLIAAARGPEGNARESLELIAFLLAAGASVDETNDVGWTPLMATAVRGRVLVAQALLARGADASRRNREGQTAADLADANGRSDLAALLRDHQRVAPVPPLPTRDA